jgi:hypothetical protein
MASQKEVRVAKKSGFKDGQKESWDRKTLSYYLLYCFSWLFGHVIVQLRIYLLLSLGEVCGVGSFLLICFSLGDKGALL